MTYTKDQLLILFMCAGIFLPYQLSYTLIFGVFLWLLATNRLREIVSLQPVGKELIVFLGFSTLSSIMHANLPGVAATLFMGALLAFFAYFNHHKSERLVEDAISISIAVCTLLFTITVILVARAYFSLNLSVADFMDYMENHRAISVFFNPNYYAMVAEYYIIMTSYRWFKAEDSDLRFRYRLLAILGLITLFFTGNRTALLVILFALMFMCYRIGHKKTFFIIVLLLTALSVSILTDCDLLPRYNHLDRSVGERLSIWKTASRGIRDNFFTGQGPLTYMNLYRTYNGYATQHAHNMLLDMFLSFGIIGVTLLASTISRFLYQLRNKLSGPRVLMAQSMLIVTVLHGAFDLTIFWHQTLFMLLLVLVPTYPLEQEITPLVNPKPLVQLLYKGNIERMCNKSRQMLKVKRSTLAVTSIK